MESTHRPQASQWNKKEKPVLRDFQYVCWKVTPQFSTGCQQLARPPRRKFLTLLVRRAVVGGCKSPTSPSWMQYCCSQASSCHQSNNDNKAVPSRASGFLFAQMGFLCPTSNPAGVQFQSGMPRKPFCPSREQGVGSVGSFSKALLSS